MAQLPANEPHYNNVHRLFLQAIANHGSLDIPRALQILEPIRQTYGNAASSDENDLRRVVNQINTKLAILEQKLDFVTTEFGEQNEYLVFNSGSHAGAADKIAILSEDESKYFKMIFDSVVTGDDHSLRTMQALNLTTSLKLTKAHAEELLDDWCTQGYFSKIGEVVVPGPRLLSEFGSVLRTKYGTFIRNCFLCKQILFTGEECPHRCRCVVHKTCFAKRFERLEKESCPSCRNVWNPLKESAVNGNGHHDHHDEDDDGMEDDE